MSGLFDRIKSTIEKLRPQLARPIPAPPVPREVELKPLEEESPKAQRRRLVGYAAEANIVHVIRAAAGKRLLVNLLYNGEWRYVESYSLRMGKTGVLFYGYCLKHDRTHSFLVHKIRQVIVIDIPYVPKWPVEL